MGVINYTTAKINDFLKKVEEAPEKLENGKTPVFITGTTTTLDPGLSATAEVVLVGTDSEGNPQYKINFGVPKGLDGAGGSGGGVADSVQWTNVLNKPTWLNRSTKPTYTATEVGALPATTIIPSKVSQLTNDSGYLTSSGFKTINGESIVGSGDIVIESSGGGGTPSGEGGNVKVTNASSLNKGNYYAFKPSVDGSVDGTFSTIPDATESKAGLMGKGDKTKLDDIKDLAKFHPSVASLTNNSTSEEILQAFGAESSQANALLNLMLLYSNAEVVEYDANYPQAFIGNIPVVMRCTYDSEAASGTLELTYVAAGGKLRTITISGKQGGISPDFTYTYSCAVTESGDDTYYLPVQISYLKPGAEKAEIDNAFGGEGKFSEAITAAINKKKLYIYSTGIGLIPVSSTSLGGFAGSLSFLYPEIATGTEKIQTITEYSVRVIYPKGYPLSMNILSLTSSSDTDTISTAVGGESGLKAIIQAVKDGNRLVFRGAYPQVDDAAVDLTVKSVAYIESENGDISLGMSLDFYLFMFYTSNTILVSYTKSSNTFTADSSSKNFG